MGEQVILGPDLHLCSGARDCRSPELGVSGTSLHYPHRYQIPFLKKKKNNSSFFWARPWPLKMAHCLLCSRQGLSWLGANSRSVTAPGKVCACPSSKFWARRPPAVVRPYPPRVPWASLPSHLCCRCCSRLERLPALLLLTTIPSPLRSLSSHCLLQGAFCGSLTLPLPVRLPLHSGFFSDCPRWMLSGTSPALRIPFYLTAGGGGGDLCWLHGIWGWDDGRTPVATDVNVKGVRRGLPTLYLAKKEWSLGEAAVPVLPGCLECAYLGGLQGKCLDGWSPPSSDFPAPSGWSLNSAGPTKLE